jgi:hypothetical protein
MEPDGVRRSSICGGVVQLVRTPACHAGGRGFESRRSRHILTRSFWKDVPATYRLIMSTVVQLALTNSCKIKDFSTAFVAIPDRDSQSSTLAPRMHADVARPW